MMPRKAKSDVFISYSRSDRAAIDSLCVDIRNRTGIDPWVDLNGIETGSQFQHVIIDAIENCKVLVFVITESSLKSQWTEREVTYAKMRHKKVCPVYINGPIELKGWFLFNFGSVDCIDYTDRAQQEKMLSDICTWVGRASQKQGVDIQPDGRRINSVLQHLVSEQQGLDREYAAIQKKHVTIKKELENAEGEVGESSRQLEEIERQRQMAMARNEMATKRREQLMRESIVFDERIVAIEKQREGVRLKIDEIKLQIGASVDSRDAFLCYSRKEPEYAIALQQVLERSGRTYWPYVKVHAQDYDAQTSHNIKLSKCCLYIVSQYAVKSFHVQGELSRAREAGIPIIAIHLDWLHPRKMDSVRPVYDVEIHVSSPDESALALAEEALMQAMDSLRPNGHNSLRVRR